MDKASVVIGYNTDPSIVSNFLCRNKSSIVVRVNGSAVNTSTVQHHNKNFYTLGHVGSATLQYADTYLSQYFVMNPVLYSQDLEKLHSIGIYPQISAHYKCLITTPYDMFINELSDKYDAGFAETLHRSKNPNYRLQFEDITRNEVSLTLKILKIRDEYFINRAKELSIDISQATYLMTDEFIENFIYSYLYLFKNIGGWNDERIVLQENVIFEGISQSFSASHNTLQNALLLSQKSNINTLEVFYALKSTSHINLDALVGSMLHDKKYLCAEINTHFNIVITHLDKNQKIQCISQEVAIELNHDEFVQYMKNTLNMNVWCNYSDNGDMMCMS